MKHTGRIQGFLAAEQGTILAVWAVAFVAIFGIVALSFDLGRVSIVRTELQSYADNVALAAAGELDGRADAITRATAAAANLISDSETFGNGDTTLSGGGDYTLTFLEDLPASDTGAITATTVDPAKAGYAMVVVNASIIDLTFSAAFSALTGNPGLDNTANAYAVAGMTQYACDVTPLMFCLPTPTPGNPTFKANAHIGEMIRMRSGGAGAAWGPGDFGFLDPGKILVDDEGPCAGKNGVQLDACLIGAIGSITQCFAQNGVDTEPGQKVGIEDAIFNVRFDIYKAIMNGKKNNPIYAPAPNVIKGIVPSGGGSCIGNNEAVSPDTLGLPRDSCFAAGTCSRYGDGNWAAGRVAYVAMNYAGVDPFPAANTRWQYYLAEIGAANLIGPNEPILSGLAETGRAQCSSNQSNNPERRIVIAAAIDCNANPINGAEVGVPVEEFFKLFLTEPVGQDGATPPNVDIWAEIVGSAGGSGAGAGAIASRFRDVVQLYR
ncbi:TadE/TadG family type IV pilus assembly protein [Candidatus Halocynthiibacter alkanivorans]|uniref:TadE/TadG family type IV pilus assembly protein n=1 Tax=Candidatus Halocynthiibacter alkanivorans TaxID=2267619 RepID=UPI000DF226DA|nr:Tad domain-containing protein [Candidatus Halocynthiibacter alkanivorans]